MTNEIGQVLGQDGICPGTNVIIVCRWLVMIKGFNRFLDGFNAFLFGNACGNGYTSVLYPKAIVTIKQSVIEKKTSFETKADGNGKRLCQSARRRGISNESTLSRAMSMRERSCPTKTYHQRLVLMSTCWCLRLLWIVSMRAVAR